MRALAIASLLLFACHREPAIVVRFDPPDAAQRPIADAAVKVDAAELRVERTEGGEGEAKDAKAVLDTLAAPHAKPECKTDGDCVLVPDGCCDCANGGKLVAVTKAAAAHRPKKDCKDVMCTMMISTDPTCGSRPACVAGACATRAARPDEKRPLRLKLPAAQ